MEDAKEAGRGAESSQAEPSGSNSQSLTDDINISVCNPRTQHKNLHLAYIKLLEEAHRLEDENAKLSMSLQSDFSKPSYSFLKWDSKQLLFLTGFPPVVFDWVLSKITLNVIRVHPRVTMEDHLLIVLTKLKLGLCDEDMGYRFQIGGEMITAICQTWIPSMCDVLNPLVQWQTDTAVRQSRPVGIFSGPFRKCVCLLDCLEIAVVTSKGNTKQVKFFVASTPAGAITFLTPGFRQNDSEKDILMRVGFFDLLNTSSMILALKSYPIHDVLDTIRVSLATPEKKSNYQVLKSPMWRHVNKVLGWWKDFGIFQTPIPAAYDEMILDVVLVCAALTNLKMSLVPEILRSSQK